MCHVPLTPVVPASHGEKLAQVCVQVAAGSFPGGGTSVWLEASVPGRALLGSDPGSPAPSVHGSSCQLFNYSQSSHGGVLGRKSWLILSFFFPLLIVSPLRRVSLIGDSVVLNFLSIISNIYLHFSSSTIGNVG